MWLRDKSPLIYLLLAGAVISCAYASWWRYHVGDSFGIPARASLIYTLLIYPIVEEIVFRGWIQGVLLRRWDRRRYLGFMF